MDSKTPSRLIAKQILTPSVRRAVKNNLELKNPLFNEAKTPAAFVLNRRPAQMLKCRMTLPNPRRYALWPALTVTMGLILATFASISFELGNGGFLTGVPQTGDFFLILSVVILMLATVLMGLALILGRMLGTTVMMAGAFPLLLAWVISSALDSRPAARFHRLIWSEAPESLRIESSQLWPTFKDGMTYTFVVVPGRPETISKLCHDAGLIRLW